MKFQIEIECENDAFMNLPSELHRILASLANRVGNAELSGVIRDLNGNWVGDYGLDPEAYEGARQDLATVWDALGDWAENSLGGRIGQGRYEENDEEYVAEWTAVCEAMYDIRNGLGLPSEAEDEADAAIAQRIADGAEDDC